MVTFRDIESDHSHVRRLRAKEEPAWTEIALSLEEDGGEGWDPRSCDTRGRPSFDSTPLYAKDEFASGLFTEAMNPADRWVAVTIADKDLKKWGPVASWLDLYASTILSSFDASGSNFYVYAVPWLATAVSYGGGFQWQEENVGAGITDLALPLRECFKDVDADGNTIRFHREFMLSGVQANKKFGDAIECRPDEQILFVHALYHNPDYDPNRQGARFMRWISCYVSPDKRDFSRIGYYRELPAHEIEWQKTAGRAWARGRGHKARADMGMLDEVARSTLTAAQFGAEPMFLVHDEDVLTAADIQPNAIIAGGMAANTGKRNVEVLDRGDQLNVPLSIHQKTREAVREAFMFSLMQVVNRPQMTASEFLGWKEERLRIMAPNLVMIQRGLASYIRRRGSILWNMGRVAPPPPELQGHPLQLEFVSPFAQAQKLARARAKMQAVGNLMQIRELDPSAVDNANLDNITRGIIDGLTGDPDDMNDPRVVEQRRQARAQATAQDVELARGAQQASIVADVAHAQQAMTSAAARGKGKAA